MCEFYYKAKLVAFIDILGYTNLISNNFNIANRNLKRINDNIQRTLDWLKYEDMISIKLFSDCFCISCDFNEANIGDFIQQIAGIHLQFTCDGIFLRGAISSGLHFENDKLIFSRGLVDAYKLSEKAIYPGTIVDKSLIDSIDVDDRYILKAPDGYFFVDYLQWPIDQLYEIRSFDDLDTFFESHKEHIIDEVCKHISNPRIIEKYRWLSEYHNKKFDELYSDFKCEDNFAIREDKYKIDIKNIFPGFEKRKGKESI